MKVSVVIPTHNREKYIIRAVDSVFNQNINADLELIVVDDASTDNTGTLIKNYMENNKQKKLKYLINKKSVGGAVSRNIGAKQATGDFIAFLDSDDEWLPNHLETGIQLLLSSGEKGCFSNFNVIFNDDVKNNNFSEKKSTVFIGDYIFSGNGDTRTSTFIFDRTSFNQIKFDEQLNKHQDWDLAIRFDKAYSMILNNLTTVNIYNDSNNRMSNKTNHEASKKFIDKHIRSLNNNSITNFYTSLASNTLRYEGKNYRFKDYLIKARKYNTKKNVKNSIKLMLLNIPIINVVKIYDKFVIKNKG